MSFTPKLKCIMHVYITVHIWSNATVAVKLVAADTYTYMYVICAQNVYHLLFLYFVAFTHLDLFFCQKKKKKWSKTWKFNGRCRSITLFSLRIKEGGRKRNARTCLPNCITTGSENWIDFRQCWTKISTEEATNHRNRWSTGSSTELQFVWAYAVELEETSWISESNSLLL